MAPPNLKQAPWEIYRETYEREMDVEKEKREERDREESERQRRERMTEKI